MFTKKKADAVVRTEPGRYVIVPLMLLACATSWSCVASVSAHKAEKDKQTRSAHNVPAVIWRDPGRVPSLNLLYGAGGKGHAPDARGTFTFVKEDLLATSPKFDVTDRQGVEWKVKLGEEPRSETAAARFLWAAGYFVDEDYYLPAFRVTNHSMPTALTSRPIVHRRRWPTRSDSGAAMAASGIISTIWGSRPTAAFSGL